MTELLRELDAQSKFLRKAAAEIAAAGHAGWGNTCLQAAEALNTHHAEIAESVKDARRYRWLLANAQTIEGRQDWYWWADDADVTPLTERIDAAIDAMHNSAREVGE